MSTYAETGETFIFIRVLDDAGQPIGQGMELTETQITELEAQLPEGWSTEQASRFA